MPPFAARLGTGVFACALAACRATAPLPPAAASSGGEALARVERLSPRDDEGAAAARPAARLDAFDLRGLRLGDPLVAGRDPCPGAAKVEGREVWLCDLDARGDAGSYLLVQGDAGRVCALNLVQRPLRSDDPSEVAATFVGHLDDLRRRLGPEDFAERAAGCGDLRACLRKAGDALRVGWRFPGRRRYVQIDVGRGGETGRVQVSVFAIDEACAPAP